ncbi:hypothetical protein [Bergeyella zoohelcum]|nr:hypothetical protein [Bergeyella zoohelcum]
MMNKLLLFLSLVLLLSCERKSYHYIIKNESGVDIEFIPYVDNVPNVQRKVTLLNNDKIDKTFVTVHLNDVYRLTHAIFGKVGLSHVEIVFNNQKKIIYKNCIGTIVTCNENPKNVFHDDFFEKYNITYTVTVEDYQNAVDCNGNCY